MINCDYTERFGSDAGPQFRDLLGIGLYGLTYLYPVYLADLRGYSAVQIGETMFSHRHLRRSVPHRQRMKSQTIEIEGAILDHKTLDQPAFNRKRLKAGKLIDSKVLSSLSASK